MFQFYPENPAQMELITQQAMRAGFTGGVVVDYPNSTKAKKYWGRISYTYVSPLVVIECFHVVQDVSVSVYWRNPYRDASGIPCIMQGTARLNFIHIRCVRLYRV